MRKSVHVCNHTKDEYSKHLVNPLSCHVKDFVKIVSFYLYEAPLIDSCLSPSCCISAIDQGKTIKDFLLIAQATDRTRFMERLSTAETHYYMFDSNTTCMKCIRILCQKKKNETELQALLRHIRNAFAHGYVYQKKLNQENYFYLKDLNEKKSLSAGIVVTSKILQSWKDYLTGKK